jgi:hypothetical protein
MLKYQEIYQIQQVRRRLKRGLYGGYYSHVHTADGDRLQEFTHGPQAVADSAANLALCLDAGRAMGPGLVVIKPYVIQLAGQETQKVSQSLWPETWVREHSQWLDSHGVNSPTQDMTTRGECSSFYTYRACLILPEHQGVYDAETGQRLTNRRATIERMWAMGFAANRGRFLQIAKTRWTGTREDLEHVTQLADQYWTRQDSSEVAKKMCSAYRSINRYAAWPGAW